MTRFVTAVLVADGPDVRDAVDPRTPGGYGAVQAAELLIQADRDQHLEAR
jgi:hypothetical protein